MQTRSKVSIPAIPGTSAEFGFSGYGIRIVPNNTPGPPANFGVVATNPQSPITIPGDYPLVVLATFPNGMQQELLIEDSSPMFFPEPFSKLQFTLQSALGSFFNRVTSTEKQLQDPQLPGMSYQYDMTIFGNHESENPSPSSANQYPGFLNYVCAAPGQSLANRLQFGNGVDGGTGANDPQSNHDNQVGAWGVDPRGHKRMRIYIMGLQNNILAAGSVELWSWDLYSGAWAVPNAANIWTPKATNAGNPQLIVDQEIGADVSRLFVACNGVGNGGGSSKDLTVVLQLR